MQRMDAQRMDHAMQHLLFGQQQQQQQQPPLQLAPGVQATRTVKNLIAIQKQSVKVRMRKQYTHTRAHSPTLSQIEEGSIIFTVDALTTGKAVVHMQCTEHVKGDVFTVVSKAQVEGEVPTGEDVELKFDLPKAVKDAKEGGFSLAILLSYTSESEGEGEGEGDASPGDMSQVTYYNKTAEGVEAVRQCLWVGKELFCLEDIYGLEEGDVDGATQGNAIEGLAADDQDSACVVCMVEEKDTTVMPCRHMCLCKECADALRRATNKCPICRAPIASLLHLTKNKGPQAAAPEGAESTA